MDVSRAPAKGAETGVKAAGPGQCPGCGTAVITCPIVDRCRETEARGAKPPEEGP